MQNTQRAQSGFFRRALGFLIDIILFVLVWVSVGGKSFSVSVDWTYENGQWATTVINRNPVYVVYFLGLFILYFIIAEAIWGRTLGKLITSQKVVDANKTKPSFGKIVLRNILKVVDMMIEPIVFLFSSKNQTVGDMAAQTYVVNTKLLEQSIEAKPVSRIRKAFGTLVVLGLVIIIGMTTVTILKTKDINRESIALIKRVQNQINTGDVSGLYQAFVPEFRAQIYFEKFEKDMFDSKVDQNIKALQVDNTRFNTWKFNDSRRAVVGGDGKSLFHLGTLRQADGDWKIYAFVIDNPDIENNK